MLIWMSRPNVKNREEAVNYGHDILAQLYELAYLNASIDSVAENSTEILFFFRSRRKI